MILLRQISKWASVHPQMARVLLFFGHVLLFFNALFLGFLTFSLEISFASWILPISIIGFYLAFYFYPRKNESGKWEYSYAYRKTFDFLLAFLAFVFLTIGFNQFCFSPTAQSEMSQVQKMPKAEFMVLDIIPETQKEVGTKRGLFSKYKKAKKEFKQALKSELKMMKKAKRTNAGKGLSVLAQVLLIILSVGIAFLILLVVLALACSASCNGMPGLAGVIGIVGLVGVLIGLFFVIRLIIRHGVNFKGKSKQGEVGVRV